MFICLIMVIVSNSNMIVVILLFLFIIMIIMVALIILLLIINMYMWCIIISSSICHIISNISNIIHMSMCIANSDINYIIMIIIISMLYVLSVLL